jgi:asparagine synthase (glutamine-hydrolysing)
MVSRLSRRYVTVALGGDGGDELFGGYKHYLSALAASVRFARVPNAVWKLLANLAERLPAGVRGRNWLGSMRESPKYSAVWATPFFSTSMRRSLLAPELAQHLEDVWAEPEAWKRSLLGSEGHLLDQLTRLDFLSYLPDDIMAKVDRASMLNSLEVRAPWLDYRLVEFAFGQVPVSMKVRNGSGKHILKRLAARLLPPDFDADRKQGFSIPLDRWLRTAGDSAVRRQLPVDGTLFRTSAAGELLQGEHRGRSNGARLFALMCIHNVLGHARQRQSS